MLSDCARHGQYSTLVKAPASLFVSALSCSLSARDPTRSDFIKSGGHRVAMVLTQANLQPRLIGLKTGVATVNPPPCHPLLSGRP
ncbi:unnamed protein product [Calypogeia fissa]